MNVYTSEPTTPAKACIIWLHGLGADAQDMSGLVDQLSMSVPVRHVFINAPIRPVTLNNNMPMRAWYNITGLKLTDREDKAGILDAETLIHNVITKQVDDGFASQHIFLAGFSQGGAMALFAGLRYKKPLAGLVALSTYIPLSSECHVAQRTNLPVFAAHGQFDDIVLPEWSQQTTAWLKSNEMNNLTIRTYPMAHAVCLDELNDLTAWLSAQILDLAGGAQ